MNVSLHPQLQSPSVDGLQPSLPNQSGPPATEIGQIDPATSYQVRIEVAPDDADLEVFLGRVYERVEEPGQAAQAYRRALEKQEDHAEAAIALERLEGS